MIKNVVGSKILKKEQVLISFLLIALLVLSSGSMVAFAKNNSYVVKPNGHDDTADIQAAFNACGASPGCTVQLVRGTYYISQVAVYGFQGEFVGMGQGVTLIQALPNLADPNPAYNAPTSATYPYGLTFTSGLPSSSNPWPALITFLNGAFSISGMTITDTYPEPVASPGWYDFGSGPITALACAINIAGQQAYASVDHMTVNGVITSEYGANMYNGICYNGTSLPLGGSPSEVGPISGTFTMTNSVFNSMISGPWIDDTLGATVTVCYNTFINDPGAVTGFFDISNTRITFCGNQDSTPAPSNVIFGGESFYNTAAPLLPSTVYVLNNNFQVSEGGSAVGLEDATPYNFPGTPSVLTAVIAGNTFQNSYTGGSNPFYSVIYTITLKSTIVSLNNIAGGGSDGVYIAGGPGTVTANTITGADTGVWLDVSSGGHVAANVIKDSVQYGISVTSTNAAGIPFTQPPSSNNFVLGNFVHGSGIDDLFWDGLGTGNHWCGNVYQTSNFLPSC